MRHFFQILVEEGELVADKKTMVQNSLQTKKKKIKRKGNAAKIFNKNLEWKTLLNGIKKITWNQSTTHIYKHICINSM